MAERATYDEGAFLPGGGAARASKITNDAFLVHADLHNHTLLSDGSGAPEDAFDAMRAAGLDVAALTDHSSLVTGLAPPQGYGAPRGLTAAGWERAGRAADAADEPGRFAAFRGFEWTEPRLGHVNVWFSSSYREVAALARIGPLYDWLGTAEPEALACFNHPGREPGMFERFRYEAAVDARLVGLEMFNRGDDYMFVDHAGGLRSPLVDCLEAGWRPGLVGVSDEHNGNWGNGEGTGRTGLWVSHLSRQGVYDALLARRSFATRIPGLRLDATANGARMGSAINVDRGKPVEFQVDLGAGKEWNGRPLQLQLFKAGPVVPDCVEVIDIEVGPVTRFVAALDRADSDWVVLRVADPTLPNLQPGPGGHPGNAFGVAYASPWWLRPGAQR